jgi:flagellar biosynthesis/type III secretory pathway M-ring protein FliF/YscJ
MNKMVVEQNVNLDEIQQEAGQNIEELEQQKDRMKRETAKMTMSFWTTLYTAAWLIVMFVGTYIVIKIFPKPK